jgi:lipoprotein-anchoring transpeptidase ErfK/SrfK
MESIKEKPKNKRRKLIIGIISFCCILILLYSGVAVYFIKHFYVGSEINGIDVSGKSIESVEEELEAELQKYRLTIKERGGKIEEITAQEVGLKYEEEEAFKDFKDGQSPLTWISSIFNEDGYNISVAATYDEEKLKERVNNLNCLDESNIIEPKNPRIKFDGSRYVVIPEEPGNKVDKDTLYRYVKEAISREKTTIDLETIDCYIKPQYTSESKVIVEAVEKLNKIVTSKITYNIGESKEVLDGSNINKWLSIDEEYVVTFAEENIKTYVDNLADKYNTLGRPVEFLTSAGKIINLSRGDYGWVINKAKETEALTAAVKEGQTVVREPIYSQTGTSRNNSSIGNTYVEVDMANQHVWFYKEGKLITDGPTVTGNVSAGHTTPEGIFSLKYKARDTVLRGPGYASSVSFWMPFNGGIGLHDANWRDNFGGEIYKTNGSHGCINLQYDVAKEIYNNIQSGIPVICHNNR